MYLYIYTIIYACLRPAAVVPVQQQSGRRLVYAHARALRTHTHTHTPSTHHCRRRRRRVVAVSRGRGRVLTVVVRRAVLSSSRSPCRFCYCYFFKFFFLFSQISTLHAAATHEELLFARRADVNGRSNIIINISCIVSSFRPGDHHVPRVLV